MSQTICALSTGPVVRKEYSVGADGLDNHGADCDIVAARGHGDPIVVFDAVFLGEAGVKFCAWLGILID